MNTYILSKVTEDETGDVLEQHLVVADTWEEAVKTSELAWAFEGNGKKLLGQIQRQALEGGVLFDIKQLLRANDGTYSLRGIL